MGPNSTKGSDNREKDGSNGLRGTFFYFCLLSSMRITILPKVAIRALSGLARVFVP